MKQSAFSTLLARVTLVSALVVLLSLPADLFAQSGADHIVSSQALQQQLALASAARQKDIATVTDFLSTSIAERALRDARMDPVQVRTAIPTLSDRELASLAARSADAQQKFSAGFLGLGTLAIIIVIVAVIIIVAAIH